MTKRKKKELSIIESFKAVVSIKNLGEEAAREYLQCRKYVTFEYPKGKPKETTEGKIPDVWECGPKNKPKKKKKQKPLPKIWKKVCGSG